MFICSLKEFIKASITLSTGLICLGTAACSLNIEGSAKIDASGNAVINAPEPSQVGAPGTSPGAGEITPPFSTPVPSETGTTDPTSQSGTPEPAGSATPPIQQPTPSPTLPSQQPSVEPSPIMSSVMTGGGNSILSSLNFEDGQLHDWGLLNFNNQPLANTETGIGSGITTDDAAHGTHSLKAVGGPAFTDAVWLTNTSLFPIVPNQLFVRFYVKLITALADSHTTFALVDGTGGGASGTNLTEVRMGGQFSYLVANLELNDAQRRSGGNGGDPENSPGVPLSPNTWYCMELLFDGVGPSMRTWLNDDEIVNLAVSQASDWSSLPSVEQWMPTMAHLKLGWQSYGTTADTVFFDDIAVSHSRIGCQMPSAAPSPTPTLSGTVFPSPSPSLSQSMSPDATGVYTENTPWALVADGCQSLCERTLPNGVITVTLNAQGYQVTDSRFSSTGQDSMPLPDGPVSYTLTGPAPRSLPGCTPVWRHFDVVLHPYAGGTFTEFITDSTLAQCGRDQNLCNCMYTASGTDTSRL